MSTQMTEHVPAVEAAQAATPTIERTYDEQIDEIVERLTWKYSRDQISVADLTVLVRRFYRQFDTARVRGFIAILVEHLVRRSIEVPSRSARAFPLTM